VTDKNSLGAGLFLMTAFPLGINLKVLPAECDRKVADWLAAA